MAADATDDADQSARGAQLRAQTAKVSQRKHFYRTEVFQIQDLLLEESEKVNWAIVVGAAAAVLQTTARARAPFEHSDRSLPDVRDRGPSSANVVLDHPTSPGTELRSLRPRARPELHNLASVHGCGRSQHLASDRRVRWPIGPPPGRDLVQGIQSGQRGTQHLL